MAGAEVLVPFTVEPVDGETAASARRRCHPHDSGGVRHVSQLPHALGLLAEIGQQCARRHSTVSHSASIASRCGSAAAAVARHPRTCRSSCRSSTTSAARRPSRRSRASVAAGPAGLLVVALDRLGQIQMRDEPHVGLVDAHAEGDRGDHDQAVLPQEPRLVGCAWPRVQAGVVRQRLDPVLRCRNPRSSRPSCATGSRRCPRRRRARAQQLQQLLPRLGSSARSGTGCWAGRSWPRNGARRPGPGVRRSRPASPAWRWRSARCAAHAASARAARTRRDSRAGSRGPTATTQCASSMANSDDRASIQQPRRGLEPAAAPAPGRAGPVRRQRRPPRPRRRSAWILRGVRGSRPGTPRACKRVDLILHQRDQRRDDHAGAGPAPARASDSTATCRRRSASAPARRRRR